MAIQYHNIVFGCSGHNIVHRDVRPDRVRVGECKIIGGTGKLMSPRGTVLYSVPEILRAAKDVDTKYDRKVDC